MLMNLLQILDESCFDFLASLMPLVGALPGRSTTLQGYSATTHRREQAITAFCKPSAGHKSAVASAAADTAQVHAALQASMGHMQQSAAYTSTIRHQDPHTLANTMWDAFQQQLLYNPSVLNTFMQLVMCLRFQSLASRVVGAMYAR